MSSSSRQPAAPAAAPFDPCDLDTYTPEALRGRSMTDLVHLLNEFPRGCELKGSTTPETARMAVLTAIALAFAAARRAADERMVARTAMFAYDDGASWLRPCLGLKRTFAPGVYAYANGSDGRRSEDGQS